MSDHRRVALHALLWLVLGGWIGAMLLFAAVVARAAFDVLPTTQLAGDLVGAVLGPLETIGMAAGLLLAVLAVVLGRSRATASLATLLATLCAVSHFGVSASLAELRAAPAGSRGAAFGWLHAASVGLLGITLLGALVLAWLHADADVSARKSGRNP